MKNIIMGFMLLILLVACGSRLEETNMPDTLLKITEIPTPTSSNATSVSMDVIKTPTVTTLNPLPADPQRIDFKAEDGVNLVGQYYPAEINPAPLVVLMHWAGGDKNDWVMVGMTDWLTNRNNFRGGGLNSPVKIYLEPYSFPKMPENLSFGVFIFDFRGYGESDGADSSLQEGWVLDARAAFENAGNLPGVDPMQVVGIGASIGSDAVADACGEGCLGALSISPGSYLNINYKEAVTELTQSGKQAWCIAAMDDQESAPTCEGAQGYAERVIIYPNGGHGMMLFKPSLNLEPPIGQVILDFLVDAFEPSN